ncbi:MAG TPA: hypothetical protein VF093_09880 [Solirubrobacterales bacterium]
MLGAIAILLVALVGTAGAFPPVAKDGKIHACYRVKGKPKGALRVVRGHKVRCRRGERKVAWPVIAVGGPEGVRGSQGAAGEAGTQSALTTTLTGQVDSLSARVAKLEGTLLGISTADLTGMLGTLDGITNEELTDAVDSLPTIESLCEQNEALAEQVNLLQGVVEGLSLEPALELIGLLEIPPLPNQLELDEFGCSAP